MVAPHVRPTVTRTTTTCIHFAIRAELDTMDRTMVALENLPFFTIHPVHSNPFIPEIPGDKTILQDGMNGSG